MTNETTTSGRPKRWLAFLLNLVFAPTGYVYAGMHRAAIYYCAALLALFLVGTLWAFNFPPGPYSIGFRPEAPIGSPSQLGLGLCLLAGVHAAWKARPRTRLTGGPAWAAAIALYLLPLVVLGSWRLLGPYGILEGGSGSMAPNLQEGDILLTAGNPYLCRTPRLAAGDVVIHRTGGVIFVKRIVAGPGQRVELADGRLIVDGQPVALQRVAHAVDGATHWRETLPNGASYIVQDFGRRDSDDFPSTQVPADAWFALGDNRDNSLDSRHSGPVRAADICGRGLKLLYSKNKAAIGKPL